jgi:hypothetical protein
MLINKKKYENIISELKKVNTWGYNENVPKEKNNFTEILNFIKNDNDSHLYVNTQEIYNIANSCHAKYLHYVSYHPINSSQYKSSEDNVNITFELLSELFVKNHISQIQYYGNGNLYNEYHKKILIKKINIIMNHVEKFDDDVINNIILIGFYKSLDLKYLDLIVFNPRVITNVFKSGDITMIEYILKNNIPYHDNKLDIFNNENTFKIFMEKDLIDFSVENLNYACLHHNINAVKYMLNNKVLANSQSIENLLVQKKKLFPHVINDVMIKSIETILELLCDFGNYILTKNDILLLTTEKITVNTKFISKDYFNDNEFVEKMKNLCDEILFFPYNFKPGKKSLISYINKGNPTLSSIKTYIKNNKITPDVETLRELCKSYKNSSKIEYIMNTYKIDLDTECLLYMLKSYDKGAGPFLAEKYESQNKNK